MAAVIVVIGKSYKSNLPYSTISPINFGTIFARENFFSKKIHPCGSGYNTSTSACFICHIPLKNLQSSAQKPFRAEDFCSIIIEGHVYRKPLKAHRSPRDVLVLFYACADSSKWGLLGRYTRSAIRRTPSGRLTCSTPILSQYQESNDGLKMRQKYEFMQKYLHISRIFTTFAV